ncbi:hypothetical protein BGZ76_001099 [Entomortierella beljakovae]|nr:hypothetical protein BGZ76_001099 [Entomortierella beljakovae]
MTRQSMLFLPWVASSGGQGSAVEFHQKQIRKMCDEEKMQKNISLGLPLEKGGDSSGDSDMDSDEETGCSGTHIHHMYLLDGQTRRPPKNHHRYICLHHDQIIPDINSFKSPNETDRQDNNDLIKSRSIATVGSKHLSLAYEARIVESNRCQFCLSPSCKANLEVQVKIGEVRVSLEWILSGMRLENNKKAHSPLLPSAVAQGKPGQTP